MKTSPSRNALLGVLGSTAALSALIAVALARGDGNNAPAPAAVTPAQPNNVSPGMVIAKDPVTGELRAPTAEEMVALQAAAPTRKTETKRPVAETFRLADGTIGVNLDESTMLFGVASKSADGTVQRTCVPSDRLDAALTTQPIAKENANEK